METKKAIHDLTNEELVKKIVETKNDMLFAELYERFSHFVYNKCYGFTKTKEEAQDLTQEVFIKLYQKLGTYKGRSKFSTWMFTFTYRACVDYVNKTVLKTVSANNLDPEDEDTLYLQIDTDDYSLFKLKEDTLKKALDIISPEDKMILLMKYQDDFSIKELVESFEISESAVKMRLKRAKARLIETYNNLR